MINRLSHAIGPSAGSAAVRLAAGLAIVVCLVAFAWSVMTRTRHFDDMDALNIIDVATNIATGRGITQSTLGFLHVSFEPDAPIPFPMTAQPPLVPVLAAGFILSGVRPIDAGVLVSVLSYAAALAFLYAVARRVYGPGIALAATAATLLHAPLRYYASSAMSDATGVAAALATLWLVLRITARRTTGPYLIIVAGAVAGIACTARYALAPLLVVGLAAIWQSQAGRIASCGAFLSSAAVPIGVAAGRNLMIEGVPAPGYLTSTRDLVTNAVDAFWFMTGAYVGRWPVPDARTTGVVLVIGLMISTVALARRHLTSTARYSFLKGQAGWLTLWNVSYITFIIVYSSLNHLDQLRHGRLLLPVVPTVVLQATVFAASCLALPSRALGLVTIVISTATLHAVVDAYRGTEGFSLERTISSSGRLSWIRDNTSARDLLIGENVVDVPVYLGRKEAISFSPYPYTEHLTYEKLAQICRSRYPPSGRAFLVLSFRHQPATEAESRETYGTFIANLRARRPESYPLVSEVTLLNDGLVFQVHCPVPGAQNRR